MNTFQTYIKKGEILPKESPIFDNYLKDLFISMGSTLEQTKKEGCTSAL